MSQTKPLEAYTDSDRTDHEIAKERIANQLRHADDGLSGTALAADVPVSRSTVYDLIQELRRDHAMPVYSFSDGYRLITTVEEFEEALASINQEIETRQQTKQELGQAWNGERGGWL